MISLSRIALSTSRGLVVSLAALAAACDSATPPPGNPDMATATVADLATKAPDPDLAMVTPPDMTVPPVKETVKIIPISAMGHDRLYGVTFDKDGNIFATGLAGDGIDATTNMKTVVAKFDRYGELVPGFGTNGVVVYDIVAGTNGEFPRTIAVQSTGRVIVTATVEHAGATDPRDRDFAIVGFTPTGQLDKTFGKDGVTILDLSDGEVVGMSYVADQAYGLARYDDDRLVVTGAIKRKGATDTDFAVVRLTAGGQLDQTFGTNGVFSLDIDMVGASPRHVTIMPDESVFMCGYDIVNNITHPVIFKLTKNGQLDASFGKGGIFNDIVLNLVTEAYAIIPNGNRLVTVGYGRDNEMESVDLVSIGLTTDGKLDQGWGNKGVARFDPGGFNDNGRFIVGLPGDRVLLVGGGRVSADAVDGVMGMLDKNGQPDTNFGPKGMRTFMLGGPSDHLWGVALSPDKTYIAAVGIKGVAAPGNDDSALVLVPITK